MKIFNFFAVAMAALTIVSCSKGDEINPNETNEGTKSVTVNISATTLTRAGKTSVPYGTRTPINNVTIFFLDGNDKISSPSATMTQAEIATGKTFTGVNSSTVKVYVVANTLNEPGYSIFQGFGSLGLNQPKSAIENLSASLYTQMNDDDDMGVNNAVLSGEASLTPTGSSQYVTYVSVTPSTCRLEVTSITGTDDVTAFSLDAIFLNTYYENFTIGGGYGGNYYGVSQTGGDLWSVASFMRDINLGMNGSLNYKPADNKVWAYSLAVGNTNPIVVFKLDNVSVGGVPTVPSTKYITVNNFKDSNTGQFITLRRGQVYVVRDVHFTAADLTDNPNAQDLTLTVNVQVNGWEVNAVDPVL